MMPGGFTGWLSFIPHAEILSPRHKVIRLLQGEGLLSEERAFAKLCHDPAGYSHSTPVPGG